MNRFINKLITRHLEPEHNVKPLLTGMYHTAPEQSKPLMEEEISDPADETGQLPERSSPVVVREERRSVSEDVADAGQTAFRDPGRRELKSPVTQLVDDARRAEASGTRPETPVKVESIMEEQQMPVRKREPYIGKGVKHIERIVKHPERDVVQEDTRESLPGAATFSEKRKEPVLRDLSEEMPVAQAGPGKGRTEISVPGIIKDNALKVFPIKVSSPAPVRQTIHVSIGRIEIKAVTPPAAMKAPPAKEPTKIMGLDQYLEQRNPAKR